MGVSGKIFQRIEKGASAVESRDGFTGTSANEEDEAKEKRMAAKSVGHWLEVGLTFNKGLRCRGNG